LSLREFSQGHSQGLKTLIKKERQANGGGGKKRERENVEVDGDQFK